jgi:hypothetical protein
MYDEILNPDPYASDWHGAKLGHIKIENLFPEQFDPPQPVIQIDLTDVNWEIANDILAYNLDRCSKCRKQHIYHFNT